MKLAPLVLAGAAMACAPPAGSQAPQGKSASAPALASPMGPDAPRLVLPIACEVGVTCEIQNYNDDDPGPEAKDYRCGSNTYQAHGGLDIRLLDMAAQARGVDVLAAAPGRVARLRDGVADISVRARDPASVTGQECGNGIVVDHGGGWETQYCHLAEGSIRVNVGDDVAAGQPIAHVGLSGNTEYPHLHLTVRRGGTVVDPFAPGAGPGTCDPIAAAEGLWTSSAASALAYKAGAVLNVGFAGGGVSMSSVEAGAIPPLTGSSPALIAYVRAINLRAGDVQELTIKGPDGAVIATGAQGPLEHSKAQYLSFVGKRATLGGPWPSGVYTATYTVRRNGALAVSREFQQTL